jgi:hypothetical protein
MPCLFDRYEFKVQRREGQLTRRLVLVLESFFRWQSGQLREYQRALQCEVRDVRFSVDMGLS